MGRHGHDRPGAVGAQHIVGNPDRNLGPVDRVDGVATGGHARLLTRVRQAFDLRRPRCLLAIGGHSGALLIAGQRVH